MVTHTPGHSVDHHLKGSSDSRLILARHKAIWPRQARYCSGVDGYERFVFKEGKKMPKNCNRVIRAHARNGNGPRQANQQMIRESIADSRDGLPST